MPSKRPTPDEPNRPAQAPTLPLSAPLTELKGVGPRLASALNKLGVKNIAQLVAYLPMRHERQEAEAPIDQLKPESIVCARGLVSATRIVARGSRPRFEAVLVDDTGRLDLVWFNGLYLRDKIHVGMKLRVQGKAKRFGPGGSSLQIVNPRHELISDAADTEPAPRTARLRPVYPASEDISTLQIEKAVTAALDPALSQITDHLNRDYRAKRELIELTSAYRAIHTPSTQEQADEGRRRLAYDELLLLLLAVRLKRAQRLARSESPVLKLTPAIDKAIRARLPFTLTQAQDSAIAQIVGDLKNSQPMNRLVQGDVGSGKTAVAVYAMLLAVANKHQSAMMAPTELLAEQHFASISRMLASANVRTLLLTGSLSAPQRAEALRAIAAGEIDIVVGTHALLTHRVRFNSLALAIVDEQHRFGVHQRATLRTKGADETSDDTPLKPNEKALTPLTPHTLVMTATPIPRTLAMTIFGDLDVSTIDQLPPGRKKVTTRVVAPPLRQEVYDFIAQRVAKGEQAFIVAPAIDAKHPDPDAELFDPQSELDSDAGEKSRSVPHAPPVPIRSVAQIASDLKHSALKSARVGIVHGQLHPTDRARVMDDFRQHRLDVLIATTVIEVGVDIPSATVMVVEDAERFGLAQLHQLRGRVGRGTKPGVCVLIGAPVTDTADQRLRAIAKLADGFKLAERDLEIRGFGDVVGIRQSGMPPFRVVNLASDLDLLTLARRDAIDLIDHDPQLDNPQHALLKRRLLKAHAKWLGIADVS